MRRSICFFLCISILFSLSLHLYSQTAVKELDQVKLSKQMHGTWQCEIGTDSVIYVKMEPLGEGGFFSWEWRASGNVFNKAKTVLGFSDQGEVIMYHLWQNGSMAMDKGKFVSEDKLMMERFLPGSDHTTILWEMTFTKSEQTWVGYIRDSEITWKPSYTATYKMIKVNE